MHNRQFSEKKETDRSVSCAFFLRAVIPIRIISRSDMEVDRVVVCRCFQLFDRLDISLRKRFEYWSFYFLVSWNGSMNILKAFKPIGSFTPNYTLLDQ